MTPDAVPIRDDMIRLGQFLKLAGLAGTGNEARDLIAEGEVTVNGEVETRRGRQLGRGDVVAVADPQGERVAVVA
jgi:ribosome-associated protein